MSQKKSIRRNVRKDDTTKNGDETILEILRKRQLEKEKGGEFVRRDDRTLCSYGTQNIEII